jgi:hypothetical protein
VTAAGRETNSLYNAACAAALAAGAVQKSDAQPSNKFVTRALELLDLAVTHGYQDAQHLRTDVDLAALHGDPRFTPLVEKLEPPARYAALWRADIEFESKLESGGAKREEKDEKTIWNEPAI